MIVMEIIMIMTELQKRADRADQSVLIFGPFWQFWVIFGLFWVILGHFWAIFCANFLGQKIGRC